MLATYDKEIYILFYCSGDSLQILKLNDVDVDTEDSDG